MDDVVPAGGQVTPDGNWGSSSPNPISGSLAYQSTNSPGMHQFYFDRATSTMPIAANEVLFTYVYLDPSSPPSEIMLQWHESGWEHRAYWGNNSISFGIDGTDSRRYMGPLPRAGMWARLEVPASRVGLEGMTVNGMGFSLYGGRATWDRVGKDAPLTGDLHIFANQDTSALATNNTTQTANGFDIFTYPNFSPDENTSVSIFATGITGNAANTDPSNDLNAAGLLVPNLAESVTVEARTTGGQTYQLPVVFAGAQGDLPGLDQCTFRLISQLQGAGNVTLTVIVNGQRSNSAVITLR
jgi:hypothetical protein